MTTIKRFTPPAHFAADNYIPLTKLEGIDLQINSVSEMKTRFGTAVILEIEGQDGVSYAITSSKRIAAMFEGFTGFPVIAKFTKVNNRWTVA